MRGYGSGRAALGRAHRTYDPGDQHTMTEDPHGRPYPDQPGPSPSAPPSAGPSAPPPAPPSYGYGYAGGYAGGSWPPPAHKPGVVPLRPLSLGDIFDGAFTTMRRNPKAMIGLGVVVTAVVLALPLVATLVAAAAGGLAGTGRGGSSEDPFASGSTDALTTVLQLTGSLFGFLGTIVLTGMLVHVVAEAVLGRRATPGQAWAAVHGRVWRLIGLTALTLLGYLVLIGVPVTAGVLVGLSAGVGPGLLVGLPLGLLALVAGIYLYVRYVQLSAPVLVLERTGVFGALRRAGQLSRGQLWRILGIYLLAALVAGFAGAIVTVPLTALGAVGPALWPGTPGALVVLLSGFLGQLAAGAITTPFTAAVASLQYVDQRIRKEGLDVQLIAASRQPGAA